MKKWHYPFLAFLIIGSYFVLTESRRESGVTGGKMEYRKASGLVFGTSYNVTYLADHDLEPELLAAMNCVDSALSMFNPASTISKVNMAHDTITVTDSMFLEVMRLAMKVSDLTHGAFDITVAPAVNAWGFGFKNSVPISQNTVDSLREIVGYSKIHERNGLIVKDDNRIMLDCSAIAKGYGSDMAARALRENGCSNFMVEIGGEVVVSGFNPHGTPWNIGISKPVDDTLSMNNGIDTIICITDIGMATSGNYRNFYIKDGRKVAHTIDPFTCTPVSHSLLSATVLAPTCAYADALATSMMVMGLDSARALVPRLPGVRAFLIFEDSDGTMRTEEVPER